MAFFIKLFTLETWREARENAKFAVSGHRVGVRNRARVRPGDTLLCYVTRTSAFVGAMEVMSKVYEIDHEDEPIWTSDPYPVRFDVKLLLRVPVDNGVRLDEVRQLAQQAAAKAQRSGARLLLARARLVEGWALDDQSQLPEAIA